MNIFLFKGYYHVQNKKDERERKRERNNLHRYSRMTGGGGGWLSHDFLDLLSSHDNVKARNSVVLCILVSV